MLDRLMTKVSSKDSSAIARNLTSTEFLIAKSVLKRYFNDDSGEIKKMLTSLVIVPSRFKGQVFFSREDDFLSVNEFTKGDFASRAVIYAEYLESLLGFGRDEMEDYIVSIERRYALYAEKERKYNDPKHTREEVLADYTEEEYDKCKEEKKLCDVRLEDAQDYYNQNHGNNGKEVEKLEEESEQIDHLYYKMKLYFEKNMCDMPVKSVVDDYAAAQTKFEDKGRTRN